MTTHFHYRVRGAAFKKGHLLVAQMKSGTHVFLPGGHVEDGESAPVALVRELEEELGVHGAVKSFLGAIENSWTEGASLHTEINLIFEVDIPSLVPGESVASREAHLNFLWIGPEELEAKNFLPLPARDLIRKWIAGDKSPWWGSSMTVL
jgi:8-oxo-dGTP pyrophosphatase MutT (NUDIX family)